MRQPTSSGIDIKETRAVKRNSTAKEPHETLKRPETTNAPSILHQERAERKRVEAELHRQEKILKTQKESLRDVSTALKVLLQYREKNRYELEAKVKSNIKALILPCIEALRHTRLGADQKVLVDLIETRIKEIVSPYIERFTVTHPSLTPKEIQVVSFIKDGKTTKEIADVMGVSCRAIEFHRYNIRKKLGLANSKTPLKTYLYSQPNY